ncbi:MAG: SPOR domain-containing protein [Tateyamaria sp.]|uniref:SPOR domain-containing protein n=1 Tax=Tateyamaria sp. TaxID=1929288 RepID=UPI00327983A4
MSRPITRSTLRSGVVLTMTLAFLAGCDESGQSVAMQAFKPNTETEGVPEPGVAIKTVERDVEAPDVFSANEAGLWDGRPSLGGVWVAHPDVTDPERVIIRNANNDKFVVGALFRRERDIPGPRLQISSDAAEALGMLAGAPAELNVTALRKEEVALEPEVAPIEADAVAAPSEVIATPLDPIESAAAAIDAPIPTIQPTAIATPEPTPVAAVAPAPAPAKTSSLAKPFIQIGIFSVEANATRTAKQMSSAGVVPTVKTFERDGKSFWRVVVGPAATSGARSDLLAKVKSEGFTDAYAVKN